MSDEKIIEAYCVNDKFVDEFTFKLAKKVKELEETIEKQKKEIEIYKGFSKLNSMNLSLLKQIKTKDKAIAEAREIVGGFWSWFHIKSTRTAPNEFLEKAKAWLENNK